MKKSIIRKPISILLSLLLALSVFGVLTVSVGATNYYGVETAATSLRTGDLFEMGMYPQTKVTDEELLSSLSQIECDMISYGYLKNADASTGTAETVDMQYADIVLDGELYRKVTINEKRPHSTRSSVYNDSYNTQADNGYFVNRTYYFKWEPIIWQVLAKESDGVAVMSYRLLDAQTFNDYFGAVTWETSSLRRWLNNDFLRFAFSETERDSIVAVEKEADNNPDSGVSGGNATTDTLWILSLKEVVRQDYGFVYTNYPDNTKVAAGTDYAKSQGLFVADNGNSNWWQRTPGGAATLVCLVEPDGATRNPYAEACETSNGVRPAFKLDLNAVVGVSDPDACSRIGHTAGEAVTENRVEATCTTEGGYQTAIYCAVCGLELERQYDTIPALGHTAGDPVTENRVEATCTEDGGYMLATYCTVCGEELDRQFELIRAPGHTPGEPVIENEVEKTCTTDGGYDEVLYCTVCGEELIREHIPDYAIGHIPSDTVVYENRVEATCTAEGGYDEVVYCTVCGEELNRTHETILASGHIEGASAIENFVEPTCTGGGSYAVVVRCTVCGEVLSRTEKTLAATGHTPGKPVVEDITDPTTEREGSYVIVTYCVECGAELGRETVTVPKLPSPEEPVNGGEPCPWCGKTVHNTVWEDFVHSVFTFLKMMLERLQFLK